MSARETAATRSAAERRAEQDARVSALVRERDTALATITALRDQLERVELLNADERAELELYRRVGGEELPSGLSIDTIERPRERAETLLVTLVQARGRDRVRGRIDVLPTSPGEATASRPEGEERRGPPPDAVASARFDLRFFETVELSLDLSATPFPDELIVSIVPDGGRHEPFRRRVEREAIRMVD